MQTDQDGSNVEPVPKKAGRHRRATRRPRITAEQVGSVLKGADLFVRTGHLITQHEAPSRWFDHLTGLAVKVVHAIAEFGPN